MNILGISGFENSIAFKKAHWPGLTEREYRISQGHDSAAALLIDGQLVAAVAEERINRKKHTGDFPVSAIQYCLDEAGLSIEAIDEIAHGFDYAPYSTAYRMNKVSSELYDDVYSRAALLKSLRRHFPNYPDERVFHVDHHLSHAASAYLTSGWNDCLVVVVDGMAEAHSGTIYHAVDGKFDKLHQISALDSIGILYSLVTLHLGFDFNADEYKIMGLAPYGNPERFKSFFRQAVQLNDGGNIRIPLLRMNQTRDDRENYIVSRQYLTQHLVQERHPDDPITDHHQDVAAALQDCLDQTMLHVCGHFASTTGLRRLALAGGVALNCTANGKLLQSGLFDDIYVQPAAGDDGTALGAALYRTSLIGIFQNQRSPVPFFGPRHSMTAIESALAAHSGQIDVLRFNSTAEACRTAAELIAAQKVIAWYRGRMEFGPRALGHRSILADPSGPNMRDRINSMVKMREAFRPFAPAVSLEEVDKWFEVAPMAALPYMIITVDVRPKYRRQLPAITHVNGSARVQTVSANDNLEFHLLLRALGKATGREMVLNTSFNIKGEPIVNTPREALNTFLRTGIEFLFLENIMVSKR
jgi:carbamoyltransferase